LKFSIDLPVQFRDIDVMGRVNNAAYLQYMETAKSDGTQHSVWNPRVPHLAHMNMWRLLMPHGVRKFEKQR
jgi:acyl-CoA thioesterase FadM